MKPARHLRHERPKLLVRVLPEPPDPCTCACVCGAGASDHACWCEPCDVCKAEPREVEAVRLDESEPCEGWGEL